MIIVHHLNQSRSQRILWLLEELELPYEIKRYARDPATRLAPPELKGVHPLGKSPVITDGGRTVHESGAIIDYLIRRHGNGRLAPATDSHAYDDYQQWLHYAEGSAMLPLMLQLYVSRIGDAGAPLKPRIDDEIANHLGFIDQSLARGPWLLGEHFTGADINLSFVGQVAGMFGRLGGYPNIAAWLERCAARPAFQTATAKEAG
ncbi:glutathione S-transferase [Phenylobacterium sp.]|jgi:glutathione S-transferase|uniref:glutathione S-transferase family protein n=1 Tax=Phenylobacterium sp. TaxID=1871053 RepID=UPI002F936538